MILISFSKKTFLYFEVQILKFKVFKKIQDCSKRLQNSQKFGLAQKEKFGMIQKKNL